MNTNVYQSETTAISALFVLLCAFLALLLTVEECGAFSCFRITPSYPRQFADVNRYVTMNRNLAGFSAVHPSSVLL
jgi:hypothetical protein